MAALDEYGKHPTETSIMETIDPEMWKDDEDDVFFPEEQEEEEEEEEYLSEDDDDYDIKADADEHPLQDQVLALGTTPEYRINETFSGRWIVIVKGHSNESRPILKNVPHNLKLITLDIAEKGQLCTHAVGSINDVLIKTIIRISKFAPPTSMLSFIRKELISNLSTVKDKAEKTFKFRTGDGSASTVTNQFIEKTWDLFEDVRGVQTDYGFIKIYDKFTNKIINLKRGVEYSKTQILERINYLNKKHVEPMPNKDISDIKSNEILLISFACNQFTRDVIRKEKRLMRFGSTVIDRKTRKEYEKQTKTRRSRVNAVIIYAGKRKKTRSKNNKKRSRRFNHR